MYFILVIVYVDNLEHIFHDDACLEITISLVLLYLYWGWYIFRDIVTWL